MNRARSFGRRGVLAVAAGLVWLVALLAPVALGDGRLDRIVSGPGGTAEPVVEMSIVGSPTLEWSGVGRGVVHMDYRLTLTDAPSTTVTLTEGSALAASPILRGQAQTITLTSEQPYEGSMSLPVRCPQRVKVGVTATGPIVEQAEIFTWVERTRDQQGNIACTII